LAFNITFKHPLDPSGWHFSQDFGVWNYDWNGYHLGEDYIAINNIELPVYATADGTVKHANTHYGYGYVVIIEHNLGDNNYVCSIQADLCRRQASAASYRLPGGSGGG